MIEPYLQEVIAEEPTPKKIKDLRSVGKTKTQR